MRGKGKVTIAMLGKMVEEENATKVHVATSKKFIFSQPYVNFVYLSGADVYPISTLATREQIRAILGQVNGVLLPGGMSNVIKSVLDLESPGKTKTVWSEYAKTVKIIMEEAKAINDRGAYFPVFGICLGFESMIAAAADDSGAVEFSGDKCVGYNARLTYTAKRAESRFLSGIPEDVLDYMSSNAVSHNYHEYMADSNKFMLTPKLRDTYRILSTSPSRDGSLSFVSAIEGLRYPFYGFQFHPELSAKCYLPPQWLDYPDLNRAADITRAIMNFVREEAQKNGHEIEKGNETKLLISSPGTMELEASTGFWYHTWD